MNKAYYGQCGSSSEPTTGARARRTGIAAGIIPEIPQSYYEHEAHYDVNNVGSLAVDFDVYASIVMSSKTDEGVGAARSVNTQPNAEQQQNSGPPGSCAA